MSRLRDAWLTLTGHSSQTAESQRLDRLIEYYNDLRMSFSAHYDAAKSGRLQGDWGTSYDTQYWNLRAYREALIARSIHVCDNDPDARSARNMVIADVIKTGIRPRARIKMGNGEPVKGLNAIIDAAWERYNDQWDATGHATFLENQQTLLRECITSGAVLLNRVRSSAPSPYMSTAVQMLSVLRLDASYDENAPSHGTDPNVAQTAYGINLDENGRPRSYWIKGIKNPISAEYMRQVFRREMAEEFTSPPWFTAALAILWANKEMIKDRIIASRFQNLVAMLMPNRMWATQQAKQQNADGQLELKSGRIFPYDPANGEPKLMQADDNVKEVLIPLRRMLLHSVSSSFGWSYQTLTRDVTEINQAAGRINVNRDRIATEMIQKWAVKTICQPEHEWLVYRLFLEGKIPGKSIRDYLDDPWRYSQCQWQAPGMPAIDPAREAQAADLNRKNRMLSLARYYAEAHGTDWRDELDQIAEEEAYCKEIGIEPTLDKPAPAAKQGGENGGSDGNGDSENDDGNGITDDGDEDAQEEGRSE